MSITARELEELVSWAREGGKRIRIRFRGFRYAVVIGRYVEAVDAMDRRVPWQAAFGPRPPHEVLSSLPVEEVTVVERDGTLRTFPRLADLLRYAGIVR